MTENELKIARLEGRLEAYEKLCESAAVGLLRREVGAIQRENRDLEDAIQSTNRQIGKAVARIAELEDRLEKASKQFVRMQKVIEALKPAVEGSKT